MLEGDQSADHWLHWEVAIIYEKLVGKIPELAEWKQLGRCTPSLTLMAE